MILRLADQHVFGRIHQDRAWPARRCHVKRLVNRLRQLINVLDEIVVLRRGAGDAERVGFLESVPPDQLARHLSGDRHDRNRVHQRIHQSRRQVGRARARSGHAHSNFAGGTGVTLGRETSILFVPHQYVLEGMVIQNVIDRKRDAPGIAKNDLRPLSNQTLNQNPRARH